MGKSEDEIVALVGPPGKASKYSKKSDPMDEEESSAEAGGEGDNEAAELSAFSEYKDALQNGSDEDGLAAYKKLMDVCG